MSRLRPESSVGDPFDDDRDTPDRLESRLTGSRGASTVRPMQRMRFHPRRLLICLGVLVGEFWLAVLAIMFAPWHIPAIFVVSFFGTLLVAVIIGPPWVMQGDLTPPPRGGGRPINSAEPTELVPRRLAREAKRGSSIDRAARVIGGLATG